MIYDAEGNHLVSTKVTYYEKSALRIEVAEIPPKLTHGSSCKLLILSSPSPYDYQGRVRRDGARSNIAMYLGHEKESRNAVRYRIDSSALIENLICDNRPYALHTPLEVKLINISKSGVRFSAPYSSLTDGDRFQMRLKINESDKLLIADVVHHIDFEPEKSEYGCRFLIGSEKVGGVANDKE